MPNPQSGPRGPCFTCHYYDGQQGWVVLCCHEKTTSRRRQMPEAGCSLWEREPGSDDRGTTGDEWVRIYTRMAEGR